MKGSAWDKLHVDSITTHRSVSLILPAVCRRYLLDNTSQYHTARLITRHGKNGKSNISKDKAFLLQEVTEELLFWDIWLCYFVAD